VVAEGAHVREGGPHAERVALAALGRRGGKFDEAGGGDARRAGGGARGVFRVRAAGGRTGGRGTDFEGRRIGRPADAPRGGAGFGNDPLFVPEGLG